MDWLLVGLETTSLAQFLRASRWGYAAVSAAHILGIALLIGTILPLNMRMLGLWTSVPLSALARVLVPVAASGLALAVAAGVLLFSIRAREYADLSVLQLKFALIGLGTVAALELHRVYGLTLRQASRRRLMVHAVVSTTCWIGALISGRLIAFVVD